MSPFVRSGDIIINIISLVVILKCQRWHVKNDDYDSYQYWWFINHKYSVYIVMLLSDTPHRNVLYQLGKT
jgi:hypothetical protein